MTKSSSIGGRSSLVRKAVKRKSPGHGDADQVDTEKAASVGSPLSTTSFSPRTLSSTRKSKGKRMQQMSLFDQFSKGKKKTEVDENDKIEGEDDYFVEKVEKSYLPRKKEILLKKRKAPSVLEVIGIDEAGRGPLAGPVVAAAIIIPTNIPGIIDSKKVTKEEDRDELYNQIVKSRGVRWAAAVIDAKRIDEINILKATLEGMSKAAKAVMELNSDLAGKEDESYMSEPASCERKGCYVVSGATPTTASVDDTKESSGSPESTGKNDKVATVENNKEKKQGKIYYYALIDGNKVPPTIPCQAESIVKGDSLEYSIAAASIIAKVTRDKLMAEYHALYPDYNLLQHKGYPTAQHMSAVKKFGASPIHRRTFAPLKHMELDKDGNIIEKAKPEKKDAGPAKKKRKAKTTAEIEESNIVTDEKKRTRRKTRRS